MCDRVGPVAGGASVQLNTPRRASRLVGRRHATRARRAWKQQSTCRVEAEVVMVVVAEVVAEVVEVLIEVVAAVAAVAAVVCVW